MILRARGEGEPATVHWKSSLNSPNIVERNEICMQRTEHSIHTVRDKNVYTYMYMCTCVNAPDTHAQKPFAL